MRRKRVEEFTTDAMQEDFNYLGEITNLWIRCRDFRLFFQNALFLVLQLLAVFLDKRCLLFDPLQPQLHLFRCIHRLQKEKHHNCWGHRLAVSNNQTPQSPITLLR